MEARPEATIESWMRIYGDGVLRTVLVITKDREASEEIAQEVFVRAWRKLDRFRGLSSPKTWLYRIAVNLAKNHLRRRRELTMEPSEVEQAHGATREEGPEASMLSQDLRRSVRAAVESLAPELRIVVALFYLEELSVNDVAATVGIPAGTVKSRLARARSELRDTLEWMGGIDE